MPLPRLSLFRSRFMLVRWPKRKPRRLLSAELSREVAQSLSLAFQCSCPVKRMDAMRMGRNDSQKKRKQETHREESNQTRQAKHNKIKKAKKTQDNEKGREESAC